MKIIFKGKEIQPGAKLVLEARKLKNFLKEKGYICWISDGNLILAERSKANGKE